MKLPHRMLGRAAALVVILGASTAAAAPNDPRIDAAIRRHIAAHDVSGAVVLVDRRGQPATLDSAGSTTMDGGMPLTTDSILWVASMTKPVVATAVMMMVEAGKVHVDDPVSKFIPEFRAVPTVRTAATPIEPVVLGAGGPPVTHGPPPVYTVAPAKRTLLVRDLLTMTAGLQTIGIPNPAIPPITPEDTLASWVPRLAAAPLDFEPGSRWAYSNATEFEVLARIVEVASGQPFATFIEQRIFAPLDMHDSSFGPRGDLAARTVALGPMASNPIMMGRFASGSAGILTTARDYGRFAAMLRDGGTFDGHRLLQAATVRTMASNQIGNLGLAGVDPGGYVGLQRKVTPGLKYGFGVAVVTDGPATGLSLPTGSFGWDGVGTRRMWVIPTLGTVLVMLVPAAGSEGGAAALHREVERIVTSSASDDTRR